MTFIYELDLAILKLYLRTKMNFIGQGIHKLDRPLQTDREGKIGEGAREGQRDENGALAGGNRCRQSVLETTTRSRQEHDKQIG